MSGTVETPDGGAGVVGGTGSSTTSVPTAPTGVRVEMVDGTPHLTWQGVQGVDSYEVTVHPGASTRLMTALDSGEAPSLDLGFLDSGHSYRFEVRGRGSGGLGQPGTFGPYSAPQPKLGSGWWISSWVLIGVVFVLGIVLWVRDAANGSPSRQSGEEEVVLEHAAQATLTLGGALLLLQLVSWGRFGLWKAIVGVDGRVSTSKSQAMIWTLFLFWAIAYYSFLRWVGGDATALDGTPLGDEGSDAWSGYLVLLGGPFASLLLAKGITTTKSENQTIQKSIEDDGRADIRQMFENDGGGTDLVDSQYLLFNISALCFVIAAFASDGVLPEIPGFLLALTSASAATYVVNKGLESDPPSVTSVFPLTGVPGEELLISGRNFLPRGEEHPPTVSIAGRVAFVQPGWSDTQVRVLIPPTVDVGPGQIRLTTSARAAVDGPTIVVEEDRATIRGVSPGAVPRSGGRVVVRGVRFVGALAQSDGRTTVVVDGVATDVEVTGSSGSLNSIVVELPEVPADVEMTRISVSPPLGSQSNEVEVPRTTAAL